VITAYDMSASAKHPYRRGAQTMKKRRDPNVYPPGLDARKVRQILVYCDALHEVDLMEDADHGFLHEPTSWVEVPLELVPRVRELVNRVIDATGWSDTEVDSAVKVYGVLQAELWPQYYQPL
jgi:hypothetical protein